MLIRHATANAEIEEYVFIFLTGNVEKYGMEKLFDYLCAEYKP